MQVTILGTGSATPTLWRNPSAQALLVGGDYYLIDCGEGTQLQMMKYKLKPSKLKGIFITHLHGDHYLGLLGLLTSLSLAKRSTPLLLWGPPGLDEIITLQLKYSGSILTYPLHFEEVDDSCSYLLYENSDLSVYTIPLIHRVHCTGYLFREKGPSRKINKSSLPEGLTIEQIKNLKSGNHVCDAEGNILYACEDFTHEAPPLSYAYCSDTIFNEQIVPIVAGVTMLYHEATFLHELHEWASRTFHSTAKQAAQIAQAAGVNTLLIGHFSSRYKDATPLLLEAQSTFANTLLAEEGKTFEIGQFISLSEVAP